MNKEKNILQSEDGILNIKQLPQEFGIKKGRKISYKGVKYQIVDIKDFSINITSGDRIGIVGISILELFNGMKNGDIRLLNKNKSVLLNGDSEDITKKVKKITQKVISNIENGILIEKKRYLTAFGLSLGGERAIIDSFLNAIFKCYNELENINCYLYITEQEPNAITVIEKIGKHFLSPKYKHLNYNVGCIVLAILRESIGSAYYKNLEKWINDWTNGAGISIYKETLLIK